MLGVVADHVAQHPLRERQVLVEQRGRLRPARALSRAAVPRVPAETARACAFAPRLLPMTDDRVRTFVKLRGRRALPFQDYFVRRRARGAVERIELRGAASARALPAAMRGPSTADVWR